MEIDPPGFQGRWGAGFRLVLAIPAFVVSSTLGGSMALGSAYGGALATAGGVVFTGTKDKQVLALDAKIVLDDLAKPTVLAGPETALLFAAYQVPYLATPADLRIGYHERTRLMAFRMVVLTLGILASGLLAPLLTGGDAGACCAIRGAATPPGWRARRRSTSGCPTSRWCSGAGSRNAFPGGRRRPPPLRPGHS